MFAKALRILCICMCCLALNTTAFAFYTGSQGSNEVEYEPAKLIVKLKNGFEPRIVRDLKGVVQTGIADFDQLNSRYEVKQQIQTLRNSPMARSHSQLKRIYSLIAAEGTDVIEMMQKYQELECVEYAHPNYKLEFLDIPDDSLYPHQWALNNTGQGCYHVMSVPGSLNDTLGIVYGTPDADIDAGEVYLNPPDATNIIVAVIDSGVDMDHPDLVGSIWSNPGEIPDNGVDDDLNGYIDDYRGWDFVGYPLMIPDNDPSDVHGHGTHCAGIIASTTNNNKGVAGVATHCKIMPLSINMGTFIEPATEAMIYAVENDADVISMSLGVPEPIPCFEDALEYAAEQGLVLVSSSGNNGNEFPVYPGSYDATITVSATDRYDHVTTYSSYGSQITVCAPGESILSLRAAGTDIYANSEPFSHIVDSMYYLLSGTSMAGPAVAGVAAWLRSASPGISRELTREIIEQTAEDFVDPYGDGSYMPGWDKYSGYGRVSLSSALEALPQVRARISSPVEHQQVSGVIDIYGIADGTEFTDYVLECGYGPNPQSWTEISSSTVPVTDDLLGSWDTGALLGRYTIRLRVGDNHWDGTTVLLVNDNVAQISTPSVEDTITNFVIVSGDAICPEFELRTLDYGSGLSPIEWDSVCHASLPAVDADLGLWTVGMLDEGIYTLRLGVQDHFGEVASTSVSVYVRSIFTGDMGWKIEFDTALTMIPNYGDFDNDGSNEIVLGTISGLVFFNPDGTPKTTDVPVLPPYDFRVPVAVGDLDADGIDDFVAVSANPPKLFGFSSNAPSFEVDLAEAPQMEQFNLGLGKHVPVVFLKDVNSDARDEIHYTSGYTDDPVNTYIYNPDGTPFSLPAVRNISAYLPADLNGDGVMEIYACDGDTLKQYDHIGQVLNYYVFEGSGEMMPDGLSAVDIDNNGQYELILKGARWNWGVGGFSSFWAFDENLEVVPGWPHETSLYAHTDTLSHPVFADIDSDNDLEYFCTHNGTYSWNLGFATGETGINAWNIDGTAYVGESGGSGLLVNTSFQDTRVNPALIEDIDGDGEPELVCSMTPKEDADYLRQAVAAWNSDGSVCDDWPFFVSSEDNWAGCGSNTPVVGDLDKNGLLDILMTTVNNHLVFTELLNCPHNTEASFCPYWRYNRSMDNTLQIKSFGGCGNVNGLGDVDIDDVVYIIMYIFSGGPAPSPIESGDVNCSGDCDIDDVVYLITYIFSGGYAPCDIDGDGNPDC